MKNWGRIDWGRTGLVRNDSKSSVDGAPPSLHKQKFVLLSIARARIGPFNYNFVCNFCLPFCWSKYNNI